MSFDNDECAKQFDKLMLSIELSKMLNIKCDREINKLMHIGSNLINIGIPDVQNNRDEIIKITKENYIKNCDVFEIDKIREKLRFLIKYIDKTIRPSVFTTFNDYINIVERDDFKITYNEFSDYKQKVNFYLRNHLDNKVISKIRNNEVISSEEVKELQQILFNDLNSSENEFKSNYNHQSLVLLVRNTVGLSKEAIDREFSKYINENELNIEQTRFISLIKNHIMRNGVIDKRILNEQPFNNYGSILDIFDGKLDIVQLIVCIINLINRNGGYIQES